MHCHAPLIEDLGIIIRLQGKAAAKERRTEEDIAQSSGVATKFEWLILIQLHQFSYYLTLYLVAVEVKKKKKTCTDRLFPKMGECREVLGGGPAPPSKL